MSLDTLALQQFIGTSMWYRHPLNRSITYTDGVKYVADEGGAYWLLDEIVTSQHEKKLKEEPFQVWKLKVNEENRHASLICEDGNNHVVFSKEIEFTDFPLASIELWYVTNVILLPSEY